MMLHENTDVSTFGDFLTKQAYIFKTNNISAVPKLDDI